MIPHARSILISGASTGIGRACALALDARGYRVFAGVRREQDGEDLRRAASGRLEPLILDVTDPTLIAAAAEQVGVQTGGRLFGLINNAGIGVGGPLEFVALDELRRQLEVNVVGAVALTQAVAPMIRAARGRIVNMSSISGRIAAPFLGPYAASKFALEALSDALRVELRPHGVRVILVEPGAISTPIWEKAFADAERMRESIAPEARGLYGPPLEAFLTAARTAAERAIPVEAVSRVVVRALEARRPKARYLVGTDAKIGALLAAVLPTGVRDRLMETGNRQ